MTQSRVQNSVKNIIYGVVQKLVSVLLPFAIKSIILYKLGKQYLGLNGLFSSILQVLTLSELGFDCAISFRLYKPVAEKDNEKIGALLNYLRKMYRIIGIVIMVAGLAVAPFLKFLIKGSHPADINLYVLFFIYLFNTLIGYFICPQYNVLLNSSQQRSAISIINLIVNIAATTLQIVLLLITANYYLYIIVLPLASLSIKLLSKFTAKKMFPEIVTSGKIDENEQSSIKQNIKDIFGHKVGGVVFDAADSIVISAVLGLSMVGLYNNYYYITTAVSGFLSAIYSAITASVGNSIISESVDKNYSDFKKLQFINYAVVTFCCCCLLCLFQPFMGLWGKLTGEDLMLPFSMVILFVIYFYISRAKQMVVVYKDAAGLWYADRLKPYVGAIANLGLNILLVHFIGLHGVLLSSIFIMAFITFPWTAAALFKGYFKKKQSPYYVEFFINLIVTILLCVITYFVCSLIPIGGVLGLLVKLLICCVLPTSLYVLLFFKTKGFKESLTLLKKVFHSKSKKEVVS